ncbi:MAG TPA: hypothetical protein VKP30_21675, partial [Polyangiaceae bacterium]|nr:hypothetical protein [Polyangiaceae bacterium]
AAIVAAMYFTSPYVLAASRTGGTAGDALVLATTVGFVITLYRWLHTERFWPYGAACGTCCGLAVGSKWTGAMLLGSVVLAWLLHLRRQKRRIWDGKVWVAVLAHQWISVGTAIVACPTLLLGLPFIKSSLGHSIQFAGIELLQFGEIRATAPFYYIPAVLVSKLSPLQLMVCLFEMGVIATHAASSRRRVGLLPSTLFLSLVPIIPLATKGFQNAHYYLAVVPTVMILSAVALERWMHSRRSGLRRAALWSAIVALVGQLGLSIYLAPDYLLAGRQFGKFFYGQFAGPAVNHCQGLPFAIREVNELIETEDGPRATYLLRSCIGILSHVIAYGPVKPDSSIAADPSTAIPREHFLIIPTSYDYDVTGRSEAVVFKRLKRARIKDCEPAGEGHVDYELWRCPPYTPQ